MNPIDSNEFNNYVTEETTPTNLASFLLLAVRMPGWERDDNNATDYDKETILRGRLIQDYLDATMDEDAATFVVPANELVNYLINYLRYCEYLAMQPLLKD